MTAILEQTTEARLQILREACDILDGIIDDSCWFQAHQVGTGLFLRVVWKRDRIDFYFEGPDGESCLVAFRVTNHGPCFDIPPLTWTGEWDGPRPRLTPESVAAIVIYTLGTRSV